MFKSLIKGSSYERPELAKLWGYNGHAGISRGVVAPKGKRYIILFVTKEKQNSLTQYKDYIEDDILHWEGEQKHGNDKRIINALKNGDKIHLFYREVHHTLFRYYGEVFLKDYSLKTVEPSSFKFYLIEPEEWEEKKIVENKNISETERENLIKSRRGQGKYRTDLINKWKGCSVTGIDNTSLLKASHIKPWSRCGNEERLDADNGLLLTPALDHIFDSGLISFEDGRIIISKELSNEEAEIMNVSRNMRLREISEETGEYLKYHRKNVFRGRL